ncbi:MAG: DUF3617 domain-containing protein [Sphingobium sp.]
MARTCFGALLAGVVLTIWAGPAGAVQAPALAALQKLEPGEWELRARGEDAETRKICMRDPRQLLQIRHARRNCKRFVIRDAPDALAVTYDCGAAGNGRTDLRVETSRLVQIRSQGVADSAPFAFAMEGRRTGACP